MNLKNIRVLVFPCVLLLCCGACNMQKQSAGGDKIEQGKQRPNIIWLVAEDLGPRFTAYGDSLAYTPNIDSLAEKGIVYENAFTVSGVCAPSRSSMITGMYPTSIGTQHMRQKAGVINISGFPKYNAVPPAEVKAFPELLRKNGYWTSSYRKLDYQFGQPFTIWDEVSDNPSWRNRNDKDKERPFFIYYTFEITHEINIWPDSTKTRFFDEFKVKRTALAPDVLKRPPYDESHKVDKSRVEVPPFLPDTSISREHIARLYDNISRMDVQIGNILKDLREDGLLENTIIMFMSDHGDCLPRSKRWIYDSGIKVPLIVHYPEKYLPKNFEQPSRDKNLYSFVDLPPTVLELAKVEIPEWIQGKSMVSELTEQPRNYIYAARDRMDNRYDIRRAVRDKNFKYIKNYKPEVAYSQEITFLNQMPLMAEIKELQKDNKLNQNQSYWLEGPKPDEELYNLKEDPFELNNLALNKNYQSDMSRLEKALENWQNTYGDLKDVPELEQAEKMWPNGIQPKTNKPRIKVESDSIFLKCGTEGSTIAYRIQDNGRWIIYENPIPKSDIQKIEVKSIRYGYEESEVTVSTFE
ncbi:arylsulfatase A-like enzyme [Flavobacteriaceae bacterium MAR_2009_75]|nr:arylsulfatase A-like enzyme [Flavobacteriaceae bacterium MAR_2009_75]